MKTGRRRVLVKAVNPEDRTISLYPSTYQWDRTDERFIKGAWLLDNFLSNPVVLWAHDQRIPAIGKALQVMEDDFGLFSVAKFHDKTEIANNVFDLYVAGFLNAWSVGFSALKYQMSPMPDGTRKGLEFTEAELNEYSAVNVPANPGALTTRGLAEIAVKLMGDSVIRKYDVNGEEVLQVAFPDPAAVQIPVDFEGGLKYVIELAKTARALPMEKPKLALLNNAIQVFGEIIDANEEGPDPKALLSLKAAVVAYADVVKNLYPAAAALVDKTTKQIEKVGIVQP